MKIDFVINPASGHAVKAWKKVEKLLQGRCDYHVHRSENGRNTEVICRELSSAGEDVTIVVVGGDGSMNDAVNGIQDFTHTRLGLIPCGSGNDLAKDLNMPRKLEEQEEMACKWRDCCVQYFQLFSRRPLPEGVEVPGKSLEELGFIP